MIITWDEMRTISLSTSFMLLLSISIILTHSHHPQALEIIIGGGGDGDGDENPSNPNCSPPPPPQPCPFESKRIEIVYPIIQKFKEKIKYDPKGVTKTWVGPDICKKYEGFFCDRVPDYNVTALAGVVFNGFGFAGDELGIDGFIDELPDITVFHANSNNFTGKIPKGIGGLRYFYELDLSNNGYSGDFPVEVLGATKLTFLDIRWNKFCGSVPPQVFMLDLDVLFINNNQFDQKLPENLGSTPALYLTLARNNLFGPIPRSIGNASKTLVEILFLNNRLSGCLPWEIGLLNKATVFDVGFNQLTGPIPCSFACLSRIQILNLAQNQFYGSIPESVCELNNLVNFSLSYNYFTWVGPICRQLIKKNVLDVRMNCILGLPSQRSKAECDAFSHKPKIFSSWPKLFNWVPCRKSRTEFDSREQLDGKSMAGAPAPRSYAALVPNRL